MDIQEILALTITSSYAALQTGVAFQTIKDLRDEIKYKKLRDSNDLINLHKGNLKKEDKLVYYLNYPGRCIGYSIVKYMLKRGK